MKDLIHEYESQLESENKNNLKSNYCMSDDEDDDMDELHENEWMGAYLEEFESEFVSYTYATVIEFSQEEGHISLPSRISSTSLKPSDDECNDSISSKLAIDPAKMTSFNRIKRDEMALSEILKLWTVPMMNLLSRKYRGMLLVSFPRSLIIY